MNYKLHYDKLIHKAQNRSILKSEYKEVHHIIPKCMGGSNDKSNLVALFPEEHIIAHLLLAKIYRENHSIIFAAYCMVNGLNKSKSRIKNNKEYRWLRMECSKYKSERLKNSHYIKTMSENKKDFFLDKYLRGKNNPNYGNRWSEEQKDIASQRQKGKLVVIDKIGVKHVIFNSDQRYLSGELVAESKGRKVSESTRLKHCINNGGSKNPNAKEYMIYDSYGNIIYNGVGGFVNFLNENKIPTYAVYTSIKNNRPMYASAATKKRAILNGNEKFIGWIFKKIVTELN